MDIQKKITPDKTFEFYYKVVGVNRSSLVKTDVYYLDQIIDDDNKLAGVLVIATEIESNPGPSITNSIESFANAFAKYCPADMYSFIESYRWDQDSPTYDLVKFDEIKIFKNPRGLSFSKPEWRRLPEKELSELAIKLKDRVNAL